ncbi:MAG: YbaB/EbfC family nucleoid-associated protein [Endomicrobiaceae bacterium]|jgi:DNA-binding protein YbaB|nr:YbaB/EbfC family nucleoid-associated protein [Endomicrobiaceae bacterium]
MELFKMAKEAMSMKSKLKEMEKVLKSKVIDINYKGILIKMNAKNEVIDLKLPEDITQKSVKDIEKLMLSAFQEAIKKSQDAMAEESKKLMGGMNFPGLN